MRPVVCVARLSLAQVSSCKDGSRFVHRAGQPRLLIVPASNFGHPTRILSGLDLQHHRTFGTCTGRISGAAPRKIFLTRSTDIFPRLLEMTIFLHNCKHVM